MAASRRSTSVLSRRFAPGRLKSRSPRSPGPWALATLLAPLAIFHPPAGAAPILALPADLPMSAWRPDFIQPEGRFAD